MRIPFLACTIPVIFLYGCAVLSDSQVENIRQFATAAKNYSNFPGETVKLSQQLHYNNDILEASAIPDSDQVIRALGKAKSTFEKGVTFSKKINLSLKLIQKYAALLKQLSSDSYTDELGKNTKELASDLGSAINLFNTELSAKIPNNTAKNISQIITVIGKRVIRNKQAKALKKFIPEGDTLIQVTAQNVTEALESGLKLLVEDCKATFESDFKIIIFNHSNKISYDILRFYIKTNEDYVVLESLRKKCIRAAGKMASAHKELKENIVRKQSLAEVLGETKDFIADVKDLYESLDTLSGNN